MPRRLGFGELWSLPEGLVATGGPGRDRRPRIPKIFRLRQIRKPNNQRPTGSGRWVKNSLKSQQPGNNHGRWLPCSMTRVMQSRACIAYSRTRDYCCTAARGDPLIARSCMSEASSRARGVRACVPYCRTALYGFPTAKCGNLLVWRHEMRSEGVANRPNGQRFWGQETSLCLLHLPTVLQRPC
jgi:hypothetical protein